MEQPLKGVSVEESGVSPKRPLIGIVAQTHEPCGGEMSLTWIVGQKYVRVLTACGGVPWIIPLVENDENTLISIYEQLDGILLTGGVDVDPSNYQEDRHPLCGETDLPRDWAEMRLVRWALRDHKPVLGVCRGLQIINVAVGGTLFQDVESQFAGALKHDWDGPPTRDSLVHSVKVESRSRLARILGLQETPVNSMHHQAIKDLAPGLMPSAWAPDGLIEAVEGVNGQYLVAVQWHPEELAETMAPMRQLFASLVDAATACRSAKI
jgi:putative glutamine amidotransferase